MNAISNSALMWRRLPPSMKVFAVSYIAFVICDAVNSALAFELLKAHLTHALRLNELVPNWAVVATILIRTAVFVAILAWALVRQSIVARALIWVRFAIWLMGLSGMLGSLITASLRTVPLQLGGLFLLVALIATLSKTARAWFARKGKTIADDLEAFS